MSREQLWAPWRIEYILGHAPKGGCFFCEYPTDIARYRENLVLIAQPHAFVCLNRYPFAAGHALVAPRRHVANLEDLSEPEYQGLMSLLREATRRVRLATGAQGMNVGFNLGAVAGAGVADHLHGHLVPRWAADTNFMPVIADVRVMPEHLDATWVRLRGAFEDLPGDRAPMPSATKPAGEGP